MAFFRMRWYPATLGDEIIGSQFGEASHEIKLCRLVSRRYFVNCIAERSRSVANRNSPCLLTSERHGRCAEAGGEATCAEAEGQYRGISPDIINRIVNRSNAIGRAEFSTREDCQA